MRYLFSRQAISAWILLAIMLAVAALTGCSPPSTYCMYPAGNSHNAEFCSRCHKHWSGKWYKNTSWRKELNGEEELCF